MTLSRTLRSILMIACLPTCAIAQGIAFTVPTFELERRALDKQRQVYRDVSERNELLYCVESWETGPARGADTRTVITRIRWTYRGGPHFISGIDAPCLDPNGKALPTIHTHSDGNCQFSRADLVTIAARGAAFDGVQCGERHFIWITSRQILALSAGLDLLRDMNTAVVPP